MPIVLLTSDQKKVLSRIVLTSAMMVLLQFIPLSGLWRLAAFGVVYVVIGYDILLKALHGITHGEVFDENFLMMVATLGAFALAVWERSGDYNEAIAVILFYQIGEFFQDYAVERSKRSIGDRLDTDPAHAEDFITRFARVYTPVVCFGALAIAVLPPLASMAFGHAPMWNSWIYRALSFLVISCPCALVISIPLSFFAAIGGASREGILVRGSHSIEVLAKMRGEVSAQDVENAGAVLAGGDPAKAVRIARKCMGIVCQNIVFAIAVKLVCLVLSGFGYTSMWFAIFADDGVMVLAVLNAFRCMFVKNL